MKKVVLTFASVLLFLKPARVRNFKASIRGSRAACCGGGAGRIAFSARAASQRASRLQQPVGRLTISSVGPRKRCSNRGFCMLRIAELVLLSFLFAVTALAAVPRVGERAPQFSLPSSNGATVALKDYISKSKIVLVFYRGYW